MTYALRQGKLGPSIDWMPYFHETSDAQEITENEAMYSGFTEAVEHGVDAWMLDEGGQRRVVVVIPMSRLAAAVVSDRLFDVEDWVALKFDENATHATITYHPEEES